MQIYAKICQRKAGFNLIFEQKNSKFFKIKPSPAWDLI